MSNNSGTGTACVREVYEAKAGLEAAARVGRNQNLKGVVHEVIARDVYNADPHRLIDGTKAVLSKSTTAVRDDILLMKNGTVVGRWQLKDTAKSINTTVKQVKEGHYVGTVLKGTKETAQAYGQAVERAASNGVKVTQKMSSTGISSQDTARIATKTLGNSAGKLTSACVGKAAVTSGVSGAAVSAGIEVISSGVKLAKGEIDGGEFVGNVAKETVGGGLAAAGGSAAATAVATGAATLLATTTAPLWVAPAIGVGAAVAAGSVIKGIWDSIWD